MAVTGISKWTCPTCTFNNWPSSVKCVLCGCSRPNEVTPQWPVGKYHSPSTAWSKITQGCVGEATKTYSPEINYRNTISSEGQTHSNSHHKGTKCKTKAKWICGSCTYSNWTNAHQCTMCGAPKGKVVRGDPSTGGNKNPNRSFSMSESILDYASNKGAVGGACLQDDHESQVRPAKLKKETKNVKSNFDKKWKCQQCTYENFYRSSRCIMCQSPRRQTPSPISSCVAVGKDTHPSLPLPPSHQTQSTSNDNRSPSNSNSSPRSSPLHSKCTSSNSNITAAGSVTCPLDPQRTLTSSSGTTVNDSEGGIITYPDPGTELTQGVETLEIAPSSQLKSGSNEVRQIRNRLTNSDWLFLNACLGMVNNEVSAVKSYVRQVGDRSRQLTKDECLVLGQQHTFSVGSTLVHLAIRFQRSEMLNLLLTPASSDARKRLPSETCPDLAASIRREMSLSLWQHKGEWPVYFVTQLTTFTLPSDIRKFCSSVQKKVLDEVVDRDVEQELDTDSGAIINWSSELVEELGSKLYPLWNRTAGDCLLDSVLQATWGVMDRESNLRRAMADSLVDGASRFYDRWKESEQRQSFAQGFSLDEDQLKQDWEAVLTLADQPGKSLEQAHIFALAHVLRRPVIVYGVRVVKNYRGEHLGFANFEGVYLPLLWEPSFCWRTPITLAYTRGHFSALVTMASSQPSGARVRSNMSQDNHMTYLPLMDSEGHLLQVHFLTEQELGSEERLLGEYCECSVTRLGTLTAKQEVSSRQQPTLMVQLVDQWLDRYRRMDKRRGAAACMYDSDSSN